jgi:hypothetical protein
MMHHPPALAHSIVHHEGHTSRVRIVARADVDQVSAELRLMFPHETVITTPIGCRHVCVYTDDAPPAQVAERIGEHLRDLAARGDSEPAPEGRRSTDEPVPDFFSTRTDTRLH